MDRLTEVLRQKDMEKLMQCVQQLLEYGAAVILLNLDETFMFRSSDRIDAVTCIRRSTAKSCIRSSAGKVMAAWKSRPARAAAAMWCCGYPD